MTEERRDDAPRDGAVRFTVIVEKRFVSFLRTYAKRNKLRLTDIIGDAFEQYIERVKSSNRRD